MLTVGGMMRRSLVYRRARTVSAVVALTVSAGVATALLTLYADLDQKMHREFRAFGANVVVTAGASGEARAAGEFDTAAEALPAGALGKVERAAGADAVAAEFGYAVATTDRGSSVVVVGTDFNAVRRLDAWWQVDRWPSADDEVLLGQKAANFVADEHAVKLRFAGNDVALRGAGRVRTGGDEDSRIFLPMATFTQWTGAGTSAVEVQIPGGAGRVEEAMGRMRRELPGMQVTAVRQLVEGESRIVERTRALMYASVVLIALTVGISVLATMSASVLERRRDFALMKALGGSQGQMVGMFLLEAMVLAGVGVGLGYVVGSGAAFGISELNFQTGAMPRLGVLPVVLVLNATIAAVAALVPARVLRGLEPAALLKGE